MVAESSHAGTLGPTGSSKACLGSGARLMSWVAGLGTPQCSTRLTQAPAVLEPMFVLSYVLVVGLCHATRLIDIDTEHVHPQASSEPVERCRLTLTGGVAQQASAAPLTRRVATCSRVLTGPILRLTRAPEAGIGPIDSTDLWLKVDRFCLQGARWRSNSQFSCTFPFENHFLVSSSKKSCAVNGVAEDGR